MSSHTLAKPTFSPQGTVVLLFIVATIAVVAAIFCVLAIPGIFWMLSHDIPGQSD